MTKNDLIDLLIANGYVTKKGKSYSLNANLVISPVSQTSDPEKLLKIFIKECKIPYRLKSHSGGFYFPAMISSYAKKYFFELYSTGKYNYHDMVSVTNQYYNSSENTMKVSLTRYFKEGLFDQLMEEFLSGNTPAEDSNYNGRPIG